MAIVVVYGPPGSGKTCCAQELQRKFGCTTLVDGWNGSGPLPHDSLALTNVAPPYPVHVDACIAAAEAKRLLEGEGA